MKLTFELDESSQRPIVILKNGLTALVDTGALFPVWVASEEMLKLLGAEKVKDDVSFSGFGGKTYGTLYRLKDFNFDGLIYPSLHIVACDKLGEQPYYMILSATMFSGLMYEIDDANHIMNVYVPEGQSVNRKVEIVDRDGRVHVLTESA